MIPSHIRNKVWQNHLEVSRLSRYYDALYKRYSTLQNTFRVMLGVTGIGAIASLLEFMPNAGAIVGGLGAVIGVIVILDLTINPNEKAVILGIISRNMSRHESQSRALWENLDMEGTNGAVALSRSEDILNTAINDITSLASIATIDALNQRCTEETYETESQRYAT